MWMMKLKPKKLGLFLAIATALLVIGAGGYGLYKQNQANLANETESSSGIAYIEDTNGASDSESQSQTRSEVDSQEEQTADLNAAEGIDAEEIVVKITDQGYVTSHGDHYHFYNGKLPADALISDTLLLAHSDYEFDAVDKVSDHDEGYVVKVGDDYGFYLKDEKQADLIRHLDEDQAVSNE